MPETGESCVQPARGPLAPETPASEAGNGSTRDAQKEESIKMTAKVGKPAPDFEANAYHEGGFKTVKLSDYRGHWVVLCFYPGDFTFV